MSRTIAIGDIHGCSKALEALISTIAPTAEDLLVFLGDYVDRGPDSRGVVDLLLKLQQQCQLVPLLGNHELMLLSVMAGEMDSSIWERYGGSETLSSYNWDLASVRDEHLAFFRSCRRYYETDTHLFMHANYIADLALEQQSDDFLFWTHVSSVLPPPHRSGKQAIVGHTPQIDGEILNLGHLICIDTCCFAGGWLTAYDVDTGRVWQTDRFGCRRSGGG